MNPRALDVESAYAYCRALTERRESNFSLGFRFLPPPQKKAIFVVYAFCRFVDDISDEMREEGIAALLQSWRDELARIYEKGESNHPIGTALADVLRTYPVPAEGFAELIAGCIQDQEKKSYATFRDLEGYCELVATSIAKVSLPVYGARDPAGAFPPGRDLSFAFQLTNILRDVREDALRGRCYIPLDELVSFGLGPEAIAAEERPPAIPELYAFLGRRCEAYFQKGRGVLEYLEPSSRPCVRVMWAAYHALLEKILADPRRAFNRQVVLTDSDKERVTAAAGT